jgi:Tol biopolymer transport system component
MKDAMTSVRTWSQPALLVTEMLARGVRLLMKTRISMALFLATATWPARAQDAATAVTQNGSKSPTINRNDSSPGTTPPPLSLSSSFRRTQAPETGRAAIQLTSGNAFCYPLYYYIPSFTADARYLVYHRAEAGQVDLHRLELRTGQSVRLTHGTCPKTGWKNWCAESGRGVLDHRSVLNVATGEVIYFTGSDGNQVRAVAVETLKDRPLFSLPPDREPIGQNCTTPDGQWLVYIDASRSTPDLQAKVMGYHFQTGEQRRLCSIDAPIHHVIAYDNEHFIFCHPPGRCGMMMTDLTSGKYVHLRDGDPGVSGQPCHFLATRRGMTYELLHAPVAGLYDPLTRRRFEFRTPFAKAYVHTGWDPEGRLWFFEKNNGAHELWFLKRLDRKAVDQWTRLSGHWENYDKKAFQKYDFHPQLTPDRRWILFTGGDSTTHTNHLFLLDASDLEPSEGVCSELLSPRGENDLYGEP